MKKKRKSINFIEEDERRLREQKGIHNIDVFIKCSELQQFILLQCGIDKYNESFHAGTIPKDQFWKVGEKIITCYLAHTKLSSQFSTLLQNLTDCNSNNDDDFQSFHFNITDTKLRHQRRQSNMLFPSSASSSSSSSSSPSFPTSTSNNDDECEPFDFYKLCPRRMTLDSVYSILVGAYLQSFPKENLMFIKSEKFYDEPETMMFKIAEFLDVNNDVDWKLIVDQHLTSPLPSFNEIDDEDTTINISIYDTVTSITRNDYKYDKLNDRNIGGAVEKLEDDEYDRLMKFYATYNNIISLQLNQSEFMNNWTNN